MSPMWLQHSELGKAWMWEEWMRRYRWDHRLCQAFSHPKSLDHSKVTGSYPDDNDEDEDDGDDKDHVDYEFNSLENCLFFHLNII